MSGFFISSGYTNNNNPGIFNPRSRQYRIRRTTHLLVIQQEPVGAGLAREHRRSRCHTPRGPIRGASPLPQDWQADCLCNPKGDNLIVDHLVNQPVATATQFDLVAVRKRMQPIGASVPYAGSAMRYSITPGFSAIQSYSRCAVWLVSWVCQYSRSHCFSRAWP